MEQPSDNISQEQARESLIAISYTSPEEESSDVKPVIITTNGFTKRNSEDAEKLRSQLISISYDESPSPSPSPDVSVSPAISNGI
ncbi:hypothetical protein EUTSA_v10009227mg [Eutrema salsugineum]|uniref:Uncharacterized protein n=1 Tax=Eutrema salsugineum TaxID=72664 RepID=V4K7I2_EUTSA|nr:uncharacterized protein LOC18991803 [Eutrema salsugineum]ESQ33545.1 hypothetical protein EUTSA_v10009227mg [Eutrema salsugineum]